MHPTDTTGEPDVPVSDASDAASEGTLDDGVWMTKAEIAAVRRISVASADRLIRRQGWRKVRGNDGRARVLVPRSWLGARAADPTVATAPMLTADAALPTDETAPPTDNTPPAPTDISRAISALEATVAAKDQVIATQSELIETLRAAKGTVEAERDELKAEAAEQRERADRLAAWMNRVWWRRLRRPGTPRT